MKTRDEQDDAVDGGHATGRIDSDGLIEAPDKRLHPWSWLFVLLQQLKQFIVPLLALLFVGRGRSGGDGMQELWPLIGVGVLVISALWRYFTYRYRITDDSVVIRSGLLHRNLRQIPFSRIHNVALHQSVLHRLFGVAEVRLESAGGKKPEAEMRVLTLSEANMLEQLVRHRGSLPTQATTDAAVSLDNVLLTLPTRELLRLGLVSNKGMLVIAAAGAATSQVSPRLLPNLVEDWGTQVFGYADSHHFAPVDYLWIGLCLVVGIALLLRLFSLLIALLQYHGFRLERHGRRLTIERGLLTRLRTSASLRRLQAFTLRETLLHRLLKRRELQVDTAVAEDHRKQRSLGELAPIATPDACDGLVRQLLPKADWPPQHWQPLHAAARWRLAMPSVLFATVLSAGLGWRFGAWGLLALLWIPWGMFVARQHAGRAGYACDDTLVSVRNGWWSRHWRFAEIDKLQGLQLKRNPLDRRCGTTTLRMDIAGASALAPRLQIRFLPDATARALYERLSLELSRRPLRW